MFNIHWIWDVFHCHHIYLVLAGSFIYIPEVIFCAWGSQQRQTLLEAGTLCTPSSLPGIVAQGPDAEASTPVDQVFWSHRAWASTQWVGTHPTSSLEHMELTADITTHSRLKNKESFTGSVSSSKILPFFFFLLSNTVSCRNSNIQLSYWKASAALSCSLLPPASQLLVSTATVQERHLLKDM